MLLTEEHAQHHLLEGAKFPQKGSAESSQSSATKELKAHLIPPLCVKLNHPF